MHTSVCACMYVFMSVCISLCIHTCVEEWESWPGYIIRTVLKLPVSIKLAGPELNSQNISGKRKHILSFL